MNLVELFRLQSEVEERASHLSGIDEAALGEHNILNIRMLALQVKLGELVNLTKCYKYSKALTTIPKNKILFRYIEGMRYLLSLGLKYNLNVIDENALDQYRNEEDIIVLFSNIYSGIEKLRASIEQDHFVDAVNNYIYVFSHYIQVARVLNVKYDEALTYFNSISA